MKPWYKNAAVLAGLVLLLLGIGNWVTGTVRMRGHQSSIATNQPGQSRTPSRRVEDLAEELELARVRMDFYHVVASGGRLMMTAGLILTTIGLARHLRPRAKRW